MKQAVKTDQAPAALGPYSQAIKAGEFVFTAGQVGIDPATGRLIEGGIEAQTQRALQNIGAILEAAGTSLSQVVKTTVFLSDMVDFAAMNGIYKGVFADDPAPARSTVQVAGLPLGAMVEIECMALLGDGQQAK